MAHLFFSLLKKKRRIDGKIGFLNDKRQKALQQVIFHFTNKYN